MIGYLFSTFSTISIIFFVTLFYKIDGYNILKEYVSIKKQKLKNLYNLVSTRHTSRIMIIFISSEMLFESFYQSLVQYLDNSVKKIGKNKYELKYIINGKLYKKIIIPERGPLPVICITNENNDDITEQILPYIGPNNNFHNEKFTPNFFDQKTLIFEMSEGNIKIFNDCQIITI